MATVVNFGDLPSGGTSWQFEGFQHDAVPVSFFVNETPPGRGPSLHKHPYQELFVLLEGQLTCTVGDETIEATGGQIVIVPADTPHSFVNPGPSVARHVDIHPSSRMITTWL